MPGPTNTLLIEGTFRELTDELSDYIDGPRKAQNAGSPSLKEEVAPLLEKVTQAEEKESEDKEDEVRDLQPSQLVCLFYSVLSFFLEREYADV